jgi:hypothetical protein
VEAEEIKRGIRNRPPPEKSFGDLCDYWLEKRAPRKRSEKDDKSIIGKHRRLRWSWPARLRAKCRGSPGRERERLPM